MSIRRTIIENSPFAALVREKYPNEPEGSVAFEYALEGYLRSVPELAALDGFEFLHIAEDTEATLRTIGLAWVLPSSWLPLDVSFRLVDGEVSYRALLGSEDEAWKGLTKQKRRKAVYLYATEGVEHDWIWDQPLEGALRPLQHP